MQLFSKQPKLNNTPYKQIVKKVTELIHDCSKIESSDIKSVLSVCTLFPNRVGSIDESHRSELLDILPEEINENNFDKFIHFLDLLTGATKIPLSKERDVIEQFLRKQINQNCSDLVSMEATLNNSAELQQLYDHAHKLTMHVHKHSEKCVEVSTNVIADPAAAKHPEHLSSTQYRVENKFESASMTSTRQKDRFSESYVETSLTAHLDNVFHPKEAFQNLGFYESLDPPFACNISSLPRYPVDDSPCLSEAAVSIKSFNGQVLIDTSNLTLQHLQQQNTTPQWLIAFDVRKRNVLY